MQSKQVLSFWVWSLLWFCFLVPGVFTQNRYPIVRGKAETILGEIAVIRSGEFQIEVTLNGRVIRVIDETKLAKRWYVGSKQIAPVSILQVVRQRIAPFDEVVLFGNTFGNMHCGGGLVMLGLRKDGYFKFSQPTSSCLNTPIIKIQKDSIEIIATPDGSMNRCGDYVPIPGGKWIYKSGKLHTMRYIQLPPPRNFKRDKDCLPRRTKHTKGKNR